MSITRRQAIVLVITGLVLASCGFALLWLPLGLIVPGSVMVAGGLLVPTRKEQP